MVTRCGHSNAPVEYALKEEERRCAGATKTHVQFKDSCDTITQRIFTAVCSFRRVSKTQKPMASWLL